MPVEIEIEGLNELRARFGKSKQVFDRELKTTMQASLHILTENVPPYPEQATNTDYIRTGTLGRSLGSGFTGGQTGQRPDIYEVRRESGGMYAATFGTRVKYAPYVIGDKEQAWMHFRWWRISDVARRAQSKLTGLFNDLAKDLTEYLEGRKGA